MIPRLVLPFALVTGCYSPETFEEDRIEAICVWYDRCEILESLDYNGVQDCIDEYTADAEQSGELGETCNPYDITAARTCVSEITASGCEDDFPYPSACMEACPSD